MNKDVRQFSDPSALARAAAEAILERSAQAIAERDLFTLVLSGGSTPKTLFELLANSEAPFLLRFPWDNTHFFWSDERCVPPDHPDSNYRMVQQAMLSKVDVPQKNVHRIRSELTDPESAANDYDHTLQEFFSERPPRFDLVLLGLGPDGHTASLFPDSSALQKNDRLVASTWVERLQTFRITMTLPVLNNARSVLFLVSGKEKAEILKEVLQGDDAHFPAQLIRPPDGELMWFIDQAAATALG